jgi:hypothetical protein
MSKLFIGLVPATILIACSAIGWKAQAAMVTGVENRLLTNSQPLVDKVRRRGYEYDHHSALRLRLCVRDTRVPETLALPTVAAQHAVLSLSSVALTQQLPPNATR